MPLPRQATAAPTSVSRADSLDAFRTIVSSSFVPLRVSRDGDDTKHAFSARLSSGDADDVVFTEVAAHPHLVERTPETITRGGDGYFKLSLLLSGSSLLVQDGREVVMGPGDLAIYDTSRPYSLLFGEEFRNLIVMFPKSRLEAPAGFAEQLTAVQLNAQHSDLTPVVTSYLSQFPAQLTSLGSGIRARLGHTSLDLINTLFAQVLDTAPVERNPQQVLLRKIYGYIDAHLASPDLSPGTVAAAHYISTRHLHALFQQEGTTVSSWIRSQRLQHCRAELLDPLTADRAVSTIGARWGFADAAHFSRVFKAEYGVSPRDLRRG